MRGVAGGISWEFPSGTLLSHGAGNRTIFAWIATGARRDGGIAAGTLAHPGEGWRPGRCRQGSAPGQRVPGIVFRRAAARAIRRRWRRVAARGARGERPGQPCAAGKMLPKYRAFVYTVAGGVAAFIRWTVR